MKFHLNLPIQERKTWAGFAAAVCLSLGLGLIAWRKPDSLGVAYDTYAMGIVSTAAAFIGGRVWEKVGLSKQGFVPTPEGSAPAPKQTPAQAPKPPVQGDQPAGQAKPPEKPAQSLLE